MRIFIYAFTALCLLVSCDVKKPVEEKQPKDTLTPPPPVSVDTIKPEPDKKRIEKKDDSVSLNFSADDKAILIKMDTLSLNSSFKKIKEVFKGVKGIGPEGGYSSLGDQGLTETVVEKKFLGYKGDLEFNFENDSLYSYYMFIEEEDPDRSDLLFQGLLEHYTRKYGECVEEKVEEENRYLRSCSWDIPRKTLILTYNMNTGQVGWGYQKQREL